MKLIIIRQADKVTGGPLFSFWLGGDKSGFHGWDPGAGLWAPNQEKDKQPKLLFHISKETGPLDSQNVFVGNDKLLKNLELEKLLAIEGTKLEFSFAVPAYALSETPPVIIYASGMVEFYRPT